MIRWPFADRRERLRREASDWVARLNGEHGDGDRAEFERWYRADPDHAAAFDRISALFATASNIRAEHARPKPSTTPPGHSRSWQGRYVLATVVAASLALILGFAVVELREASRPARESVQVDVFAATARDARLLRLADGSEVVLAPGSELAVEIDGHGRRLELRRGEGHFTVFHEPRPFLVTARGTEVIARGTQFVVRILPEGTLVSLIEGRVEVSYLSAADGRRRVESLGPGQRLTVAASTGAQPTDRPKGASRSSMIELDDTRLADALSLVRRDSKEKIRLADPGLAELRVTGAFAAGDAEGFAQAVAAALDLEVTRDPDGAFRLGRRSKPTD